MLYWSHGVPRSLTVSVRPVQLVLLILRAVFGLSKYINSETLQCFAHVRRFFLTLTPLGSLKLSKHMSPSARALLRTASAVALCVPTHEGIAGTTCLTSSCSTLSDRLVSGHTKTTAPVHSTEEYRAASVLGTLRAGRVITPDHIPHTIKYTPRANHPDPPVMYDHVYP